MLISPPQITRVRRVSPSLDRNMNRARKSFVPRIFAAIWGRSYRANVSVELPALQSFTTPNHGRESKLGPQPTRQFSGKTSPDFFNFLAVSGKYA